MIKFESEINHNVQVIRIVGSLDATTAAEATAYLDKSVQNNSQIVLDMTHLEYLSSAGVRVILGLIKATRSQNGDLRLVNMRGMVLETLELAGITSIVKLYDGLDSAVTSFQN